MGNTKYMICAVSTDSADRERCDICGNKVSIESLSLQYCIRASDINIACIECTNVMIKDADQGDIRLYTAYTASKGLSAPVDDLSRIRDVLAGNKDPISATCVDGSTVGIGIRGVISDMLSSSGVKSGKKKELISLLMLEGISEVTSSPKIIGNDFTDSAVLFDDTVKIGLVAGNKMEVGDTNTDACSGGDRIDIFQYDNYPEGKESMDYIVCARCYNPVWCYNTTATGAVLCGSCFGIWLSKRVLDKRAVNIILDNSCDIASMVIAVRLMVGVLRYDMVKSTEW